MKEHKLGSSNLIAPPHNRSYYKTEDGYLRAVYRKNKQKMAEEGFSYAIFKENVISVKKYHKLNVRDAVEAIGRGRAFMTEDEIAKQNLMESVNKKELKSFLRKNELLYDEFTKDKRRAKIDWDKFVWNKDTKRYEYGKVGIQFVVTENSEEEPWWEVIDI